MGSERVLGAAAAFFFALLVVFGPFLAASAYPGKNGGEFLRIEPSAVLTAGVDNHAAPFAVLAASHELFAFGTLAVFPARARLMFEPGQFDAGGFAFHFDRGGFGRGFGGEIGKGLIAQPQAGTAVAFHHADFLFAELAAAHVRTARAGGAGERLDFAGHHFSRELAAAGMAELGTIAHARQAVGANRLHVEFVQGEIGPAMSAKG